MHVSLKEREKKIEGATLMKKKTALLTMKEMEGTLDEGKWNRFYENKSFYPGEILRRQRESTTGKSAEGERE